MKEHAVVIAGGGPTGLMLAGELALAGIDIALVALDQRRLTAVDRLLRRDRALAATGLAATTALAWASLVRMGSGMGALAWPGRRAHPGGLGLVDVDVSRSCDPSAWPWC